MTGRILRRSGYPYSILEMEQTDRDRMGQLGREAQEILTVQDQDRWQKASGPDFLAHLVGGAIILQRLGQSTKKAILLEDDGAHLAFMTCSFLALVAAQLNPDLRDTLEQTIKLLAQCCPIEVSIRALPPIETLPDQYRNSSIIRRQYQSFAESTKTPRDVMLADALALLRIFEITRRPEDCDILAELSAITEGLRTALQRVRTT